MGLERNRKSRNRRRRGMAMVEMVFVLPLLLLIMFAIAELGIMFSRWLTLSNAVREGARVGVVFRDPATCATQDVNDLIEAAIKNYAAGGGIDADGVSLAITINGPPCGAPGTSLQVQADYDHQLNIPFADTLGTINLNYSSTMRNE